MPILRLVEDVSYHSDLPDPRTPNLGGSSSLWISSGVVRAGVSGVGGAVGLNRSNRGFFVLMNLAELVTIFSFLSCSGYINF